MASHTNYTTDFLSDGLKRIRPEYDVWLLPMFSENSATNHQNFEIYEKSSLKDDTFQNENALDFLTKHCMMIDFQNQTTKRYGEENS